MLGRNRITRLGVDEPGKAELDQDLLTAARSAPTTRPWLPAQTPH
jgi:hypothetical protein